MMTSDTDKSLKVLMQALHQLHGGSSEVALFAVGLLLLIGVIGGALVACWIFRGGLSRAAWERENDVGQVLH